MNITQLLTPIAQVPWIAAADTVRDAFDHMETYDLGAAVMLDPAGRYLGTITEADLKKHVAAAADRSAAFATPLAEVHRRSSNAAVSVDRDVESVVDQASLHPFIPVVDGAGRLVGIVDRRRILAARLPSAA